MNPDAWQDAISVFPPRVQEQLGTARLSGRIEGRSVSEVQQKLGDDLASLMVRLLPLAACFAKIPISNFPVGAIAAGKDDGSGNGSLYFGANMEFPTVALNNSVHAEQAAVTNAWHSGETQVSRIAVSAAPCGHCRQFLHEICEADPPLIVLPRQQTTADAKGHLEAPLSKFLPDAFGPANLGVSGSLLTSVADAGVADALLAAIDTQDALAQAAANAATRSYSPYSKNFAGCAVATSNGGIFAGRYAENAAYNPSLSPLQSALVYCHLNMGDRRYTIERAVLVEMSAESSQFMATQTLLSVVAPNAQLEYFPANSI